jgi:CRISPR-associated protein Cmr1
MASSSEEVSVLEIKCKVVTPMFSRGAAEPKWENGNRVYPFELRPQSIKGVLRFWFRAIAPTVIDIYSLEGLENLSKKEKERWEKEKYKGLKYLEGLIFGSQERKSPFSLGVEVKGESQALGSFEKRGRNHRIQIENGQLRPLKYFLYGLYDEKNAVSYEFLPPDSEFRIFIYTANKNIEEIILSLFKLVSTFSGFGAKTRKGFGEFLILEPSFDRNNYKDAIEGCQKAIEKFMKIHNSRSDIKFKPSQNTFAEIPEFPNFCDYNIFEFSIRDCRFWSDALKKFSYTYRNLKRILRKSKGDCVKEIVDALRGIKREVILPPAVMGLPLLYQRLKGFEDKRVAIFSSLQNLDLEEKRGRKPSPLFISLHEDGGNWKVAVLVMRSRITSNEEGKLETILFEDEGKEKESLFIVRMNERESYEELYKCLRKQSKEIQGG